MSSERKSDVREARPRLALAFVLLAVSVATAIFLLTEQSPVETSRESSFVNDLLVGLFGGLPGLYDPQTGLWLGIGIRHWAHTAEFGLFGVLVALAVWFAVRPRVFLAGGVSLAICAACSLFDQCHKLFVPGRHWDWFDLAMDALGYVVAIAVVVAVAGVGMARRMKEMVADGASN